MQALASFTIEAAYAAHAERDLGSIEAGKLADFVVLSRDIMTVAPADVPGTEVRRTFIGGRQVFPSSPDSLHAFICAAHLRGGGACLAARLPGPRASQPSPDSSSSSSS